MARHLNNALYHEARNAGGSVVRVRELIAALQTLPPEALVFTLDGSMVVDAWESDEDFDDVGVIVDTWASPRQLAEAAEDEDKEPTTRTDED